MNFIFYGKSGQLTTIKRSHGFPCKSEGNCAKICKYKKNEMPAEQLLWCSSFVCGCIYVNKAATVILKSHQISTLLYAARTSVLLNIVSLPTHLSARRIWNFHQDATRTIFIWRNCASHINIQQSNKHMMALNWMLEYGDGPMVILSHIQLLRIFSGACIVLYSPCLASFSSCYSQCGHMHIWTHIKFRRHIKYGFGYFSSLFLRTKKLRICRHSWYLWFHFAKEKAPMFIVIDRVCARVCVCLYVRCKCKCKCKWGWCFFFVKYRLPYTLDNTSLY